ncbi:MAG: T9SS type A sorting domain-containing protein [Bacteroidales bacterium]|nr:T9SS type A sorting domain-containing protein [Bacteroidales bacterium]
MKVINLGEKKIDISPNPFSTYTILTVPDEVIKPYSLELFNTEGDKIFSQTNIISNKFILGGNKLQIGTYFCKVFSHDFSFIFTGKIIVN